eukprot:4161988-Alexandrium_andersonii.AAC.1
MAGEPPVGATLPEDKGRRVASVPDGRGEGQHTLEQSRAGISPALSKTGALPPHVGPILLSKPAPRTDATVVLYSRPNMNEDALSPHAKHADAPQEGLIWGFQLFQGPSRDRQVSLSVAVEVGPIGLKPGSPSLSVGTSENGLKPLNRGVEE